MPGGRKDPTKRKKRAVKTKKIERPVEAKPEVPQEPASVTQEKLLKEDDLVIGYLVGLTEEGALVFQVYGKSQGIVELLGIHQIAGSKITQNLQANQGTGDRLTHEVGLGISTLNRKLDMLLAAKKPDNTL